MMWFFLSITIVSIPYIGKGEAKYLLVRVKWVRTMCFNTLYR